jgi:putative sigma-54 modulation protein
MTLKVEINVRNLELSEHLNAYVTKKVGKLDRHLDVLEEVKVDLSFLKSARDADDRQVAQLTIRGKGILLRAEERSDDIFASIDAATEKILRQIERYKGRHWRGRGDARSAAHATRSATELADDTGDLQGPILRRKRFQLQPMDEQEAVEQMELLGHEDFFVFLNATTNEVNVLYRRRDGSLGLIETELA